MNPINLESSAKVKRNFYSKNHQIVSKKYKETPLVLCYRPRLSELDLPPPNWRLFTKQNDAIDFARSSSEKLFVFSNEIAEGGVRNFIATSLEEFWFYYSQKKSEDRHLYEVIQDQAPCHLYFDIEYDKTLNPEKKGENMISIWIEYVSACLQHHFGLVVTRENVLELDSSSVAKFSQHLIFHLSGFCAFKTNVEVGKFVKQICSDLEHFIAVDDEFTDANFDWIHEMDFREKLQDLFVKTRNGNEVFVDRGVYTKNRNFRLILSSKLNKNVELRLSKSCRFDYKFLMSETPIYQPFKPGIITGTCHNLINMKCLFFASIVTNVCEDKVKKFLEMQDYATTTHKTVKIPRHVTDTIPSNTGSLFCGIPFEDIAQFITNYVKQFNPNARVRKWTYFPTTRVINYDITGTRYCHNIGREHRSNNIMYVVDVASKTCHQKCYDPSCRAIDYKSPVFPLSQDIIDVIMCMELIDQLEDQELIKTAESIEEMTNEILDYDLINALDEFESNKN